MKKILIIGGSVAGHTVAVRLRELDKDTQITLCTEGRYPLYDKRKLCKIISGAIPEKDIFLASDDFYAANNIIFAKDKKAVSINTEKRIAYFKDKNNLEYDFLVIASGRRVSLPETPGIKKKGVMTLSTLDDYRILANLVSKDPVCLVGSDECVIDTARVLAEKYKIEVKLASQRSLNDSLLPPEIAIIPAALEEIIGEGQVQAVKFKDGKAIGVSTVAFRQDFKSNLEFLKNSDIAILEDFIIVDDLLRTSKEEIFACGAIARSRNELAKIKTWEETVNEAQVLADNLTKTNKMYPSQLNLTKAARD